MFFGRPTGNAMPLMWAHAEYVKLLRSMRDGQVFDRVSPVAQRYQERHGHAPLEVWTFIRQPRVVRAGANLRVQAAASFRLRWTADGWVTAQDTASTATTLGLEYVDVPIAQVQEKPIRFTFFWPETGRWEGRAFEVAAERGVHVEEVGSSRGP
jgi:glucoamylase